MAGRRLKVYVGAGHGYAPNGTVQPGTQHGGQSEVEWALRICAKVAHRLKLSGVTVMAESDRANPNYIGSVARANEWGADLAVDLHFDWYRGVSELWPLYRSSTGLLVSQYIVNFAPPGEFRNPTFRGDLYFLNQTSMPAVLVECGRIGSLSEVLIDRRATYIVRGICKWAVKQGFRGIDTSTWLDVSAEREDEEEMPLSNQDVNRVATKVLSDLADAIRGTGPESNGRLRRELIELVQHAMRDEARASSHPMTPLFSYPETVRTRYLSTVEGTQMRSTGPLPDVETGNHD